MAQGCAAAAAQRLGRGRLPHSLLLISAPGLGAEALANWAAALALCESAGTRPCDACASCRLLRSDTHPDAHVVRLEEDAQQIKIDQVRELIQALTLKSYRGGYKVGIIEGAEALNAHGANAFLKTLEEPTADTVLIMIARPGIACRRPSPAAVCALACGRRQLRRDLLGWRRIHAALQPWDAALALAGGAPLLALQLDGAGLAALDTDMRECLAELSRGAVDVTLLAERWARSNPDVRITWLENWITQRVRCCSE